MKVLIFEYATAIGIEDPDFLFEGQAMLEGLLDDFNQIINGKNVETDSHFLNSSQNSFNSPNSVCFGEGNNKRTMEDENDLEVSYLIAKKFLLEEYLIKWGLCTPLITEGLNDISELEKWLEAHISDFDACIFVAAEENLELYKLTKILENNGVTVLGSDSQAVLECSDKLKTYESLQNLNDNLPLINTYKIDFNQFNKESNGNALNGNAPDFVHKDFSKDFIDKYSPLFSNSHKMIIKPADGVACQGVKLLNSFEDFKEELNSVKTSLSHVILQDFIEGQPCSVSLISNGSKAIPISLNLQKIKFDELGFEYGGGEVPWDHPLKHEAMQVAKKAVESIEGLKGYVGVDLILSDKVYLLEINSRLTTPYVALRHLTDFNMGLAVINAINGYLPEEFSLSGCAEFQKGTQKLDINKKS